MIPFLVDLLNTSLFSSVVYFVKYFCENVFSQTWRGTILSYLTPNLMVGKFEALN